MHSMESVVGKKHEGALPGDDVDRVIAAEGDVGIRAGAASGLGAIHPDAAEKDLPAPGAGAFF